MKWQRSAKKENVPTELLHLLDAPIAVSRILVLLTDSFSGGGHSWGSAYTGSNGRDMRRVGSTSLATSGKRKSLFPGANKNGPEDY
jgi:hypothetical protein